ncbi:thiamine diphosphokinase [Cytobacillus sp. IB215665]|uniref:thiamine diphosphokinase n=1 Tax=Cytobacillus sp. IB215665 TaxID=3097357 RepID=UPI002A13AEB9|nr:thiamine diphosphokinase [Cytobacillus sp. IB215665]MDX8365020.1 thiamine diphosphokinase [Cytobacillus sp. IB215665]
MIINIVGGGPIRYVPSLQQYNCEDCLWVGADRGVLYLIHSDIVPSHAFGDFDSITADEMRYIEQKLKHVHLFPEEKDLTDIEIALQWALAQQPTTIQMFGCSGGRLDHLLGNIQLLVNGLTKDVQIHLIDTQNNVTMYEPGSYYVNKHESYRYISFLPFSKEVEQLSLSGFKYPLENCHITLGSTLCISNELNDDRGTFSFTSGILLMVRSTD